MILKNATDAPQNEHIKRGMVFELKALTSSSNQICFYFQLRTPSFFLSTPPIS